MEHHICVTCGAMFPATDGPPSNCLICDDERQYVGHQGQRWTTLGELRSDHRNAVQAIEPGLTGIVTEPRFAIGQQAHLIETPAGNVLWNCISLIDDDTVGEIERRGGLAAIAVSHPHFYTGVAEWSRAFGGVPILLHADDRAWVTRPDEAIRFWQGETAEALPGSGLTLVRCGGHFPGSCVLHWPEGAGGAGALLTGDTIQVVGDRRWVSFMYSYPNLVPLGAEAVRGIVAAVEPYRFDRLYGGWPESVVATDAKEAVRRSAERYWRGSVARRRAALSRQSGQRQASDRNERDTRRFTGAAVVWDADPSTAQCRRGSAVRAFDKRRASVTIEVSLVVTVPWAGTPTPTRHPMPSADAITGHDRSPCHRANGVALPGAATRRSTFGAAPGSALTGQSCPLPAPRAGRGRATTDNRRGQSAVRFYRAHGGPRRVAAPDHWRVRRGPHRTVRVRRRPGDAAPAGRGLPGEPPLHRLLVRR